MHDLKHVVLLGAESTGKTTLARMLAAHYGTAWVPEAARLFVETHRRPVAYADVDAIARQHLAAVAAAQAQAHRVLFLDTDLIATVLYSQYYFGRVPAWVQQAAAAHQGDAYLLTAADIPWQPDPDQRESPAARDRLQALFEADLARRGVALVRVQGSVEARMQAAVAAVEALLQQATDR